MSTSLLWNLSMFELPGVVEGGMSERNVQRKPGTARGSPRRSRSSEGIAYKPPVPMSGSAISAFRHHMIDRWHRALMRRSQRRLTKNTGSRDLQTELFQDYRLAIFR